VLNFLPGSDCSSNCVLFCFRDDLARALSLKCKVLAESLKKPLHEVCTTLIVDVFPMGSYLARIVIPRRVAPPPALARASSVLATQANASTDPQEKK
jgi:hypothetical protein